MGNCRDIAAHRNPVVEFKLRVEERLDKLSSEGKISYTAIGTGIFFDWGDVDSSYTHTSCFFLILTTALKIGFFGIDLLNKKALLLNDGNLKLNLTSLSSTAGAIVTILSNPNLIKNRCALIHDLFISQNDVLKVVEEELGAKFEVSYLSTNNLQRQSEAALAAGDSTAVFGLIKAAAWGPDSPCAWGVDDDSMTLGHPPKDLREEVVKVMTMLNSGA